MGGTYSVIKKIDNDLVRNRTNLTLLMTSDTESALLSDCAYLLNKSSMVCQIHSGTSLHMLTRGDGHI